MCDSWISSRWSASERCLAWRTSTLCHSKRRGRPGHAFQAHWHAGQRRACGGNVCPRHSARPRGSGRGLTVPPGDADAFVMAIRTPADEKENSLGLQRPRLRADALSRDKVWWHSNRRSRRRWIGHESGGVTSAACLGSTQRTPPMRLWCGEPPGSNGAWSDGVMPARRPPPSEDAGCVRIQRYGPSLRGAALTEPSRAALSRA